MFAGVAAEFGAGVQAEFGAELAAVGFDGAEAEVEPAGDFGVGVAFGEQAQDLDLAVGQG